MSTPTFQITPDGARYLSEQPPAPFHLRILLPALCRDNLTRWRIAAWSGTIAMLAGTVLLAPDWRQGAAAALLFIDAHVEMDRLGSRDEFVQ